MTTLVPRTPYTDDELRKLYPPGLELQLVQILMRHGERTPVSARFQNAGLQPFWPYCASARQLRSVVLEDGGDDDDNSNQMLVDSGVAKAPAATFSTLEWKRRLESFGSGDEPVLATGPRGELDDVCDLGGLTDVGRHSTYRLGRRLRALYVDRLGFLPPAIDSPDFLYLRSTPVPRALDSLQQAFSALYPPSTRRPGPDGRPFPAPTILTRAPADETLFPNDSNCRRFAALSRAFAQRAADRWNGSPEMAHLNSKMGKWMPPESPRIAVDSRPRLSGILDTVNSTLAHGPATRLPGEFYDARARAAMERIAVEEWFAGYEESREYRMLGIGGLLGDVVGRMVGSAERSAADGRYELAEKSGPGQSKVLFGLSGCHDTTLAAVLASLGAFGRPEWPPYTSHVAIEMFRRANVEPQPPPGEPQPPPPPPPRAPPATVPAKRTWWGQVIMTPSPTPSGTPLGTPPPGIGRKPTAQLTPAEAKTLDGYYVRMRYNDEPVTVPGCRLPGNHLEGDESFCTLAAFKAIVDKFTPQNWRQQCRANMNLPASPTGQPEWAGYA